MTLVSWQTTDQPTHRRSFLRSGAWWASSLAVGTNSLRWLKADAAVQTAKHYRVERIDRTTVRIPYREVPARNMARELPHWQYVEVFEVQLGSGKVGIGETLLYYTWGVSEDEDVRRVAGGNAVDLMWDDSLGAGLQMALFDAVGRTAEVPIHRLLGHQVHDQTPLSWWNIDTSPEDMVTECQEALRLGYQAYKTKGRPWFDLWQQVELAANALPESFKIDMDFNNTLLDAERAIPILKELEKYPQIGIYETPIPQSDVIGNKRICEATRVPIAFHYGNPDPVVAIRERACDGFVVGGGASRVMRQGAVAAMADMPFWLQLVGTGLTAAYSLHFGGVLSHATWPAVNCHQLYQVPLLIEPIVVQNGFSQVPNTAGLGYDLDREALVKLRVDKPKSRPDPPRLVETTWPDGRKLYFASHRRVNFVLSPLMKPGGGYPYFERGVRTRLVPNDGSERWRQLYQKAEPRPHLLDPQKSRQE